MSIREWAAFGVDLVHILLLGVVYVSGLAIMTANARFYATCLNLWLSVNWRSAGRPN